MINLSTSHVAYNYSGGGGGGGWGGGGGGGGGVGIGVEICKWNYPSNLFMHGELGTFLKTRKSS